MEQSGAPSFQWTSMEPGTSCESALSDASSRVNANMQEAIKRIKDASGAELSAATDRRHGLCACDHGLRNSRA